jgi:hypothetical protein
VSPIPEGHGFSRAAKARDFPTFPLHFPSTNGKVTKRQEQPDEYQIA